MTSLKKKWNNIKPCILQRISNQAKQCYQKGTKLKFEFFTTVKLKILGSKNCFKSKILKKQTVNMDAKVVMDSNIQQRCHSLAINVFTKSLLN